MASLFVTGHLERLGEAIALWAALRYRMDGRCSAGDFVQREGLVEAWQGVLAASVEAGA